MTPSNHSDSTSGVSKPVGLVTDQWSVFTELIDRTKLGTLLPVRKVDELKVCSLIIKEEVDLRTSECKNVHLNWENNCQIKIKPAFFFTFNRSFAETPFREKRDKTHKATKFVHSMNGSICVRY
jgi:hypothetical protein